MTAGEVFGVRLEPDLRRVLQLAAERTGRTEANVLRQLVRQLDPERLVTGFPPTQLEAQASEREKVAA